MDENTQKIEMRKKKRSRRKNIMLALLILVLVLSTLCTLYMNIDNPHLHNLFSGIGLDVADNKSTIEFDKTEKFAVAGFDGDVVASGGGGISCYTENMDTSWTVAKNNTFPVIKTSGRYVLSYNFDVENATLIKGGKATELVTGNNVIGGSVNDDGYCAIITREKGYKAQVIVYTPEGDVIYKWHSADNHITDAVVSPDNKTLVAATVDFSTNTASGGLMFFNFSQEKPYAGQILENNIIMQIKFADKDSLLVVGDVSSCVYDILGAKEQEYSYEGKKLTNFYIDSDGNVIVALAESDSSSTETSVKMLNKKLKEKGTYTTKGAVTSIHAAEGDILLVTGRTLLAVSMRGNEIKKLDVNKDVKNAVLFGNGKDAMIVAGSEAEVVSLN